MLFAIGLIVAIVGFFGFKATEYVFFVPRGWKWNDTWMAVWIIGLALMIASVAILAWRTMP